MEIFVTGATGGIGSAVSRVLLEKGHTVSGLARSDEAAAALRAAGVTPVRGSLEDTAALEQAAARAGATVHTAMQWGEEAGALDARTVATLIQALSGSNKPLVYTSGICLMGETQGRVAGEMFPVRPPAVLSWRPAVERTVQDAKERNVRGVVLRPAMVYGRGGGLVGMMLRQARERGVIQLPGTGANHWSFVHVDDLAALYHLAIERAAAGSLYLAAHGTAVTARAVAEMAAKAAGVPGRVEFISVDAARATMGTMADCLVLDQKVLSTKAARELGWKPCGPGVLQALAAGAA